MWEFLLYFYGLIIFFYSMGLMISYVFLLISAYSLNNSYRPKTVSLFYINRTVG